MKILIIPCDGNSQPKAKATSDHGITRAQHAAREYHRSAKLRKAKSKSHSDHGNHQLKTSDVGDSTQATDATQLPVELPSLLQPFLGPTRADPFQSGCKSNAPPYVHEMLDHAICYQWSEFRLSDGDAGLNAAKAEIMQSVLKSPVAWYAIIFAGATHNAYQHGAYGIPKQNEQLRLFYKTKAIELLLAEINRNGEKVSEETLVSMIVLASHGTGENLDGADSAKHRDLRLPFVPHVHGVEYYSAMDPGLEHLQALYSLVDKRGGLRTIKLRSLAICIQLYDIYASWTQLQAPHFDLLAPTKYAISLRAHMTDSLARDMLQRQTKGFQALLVCGYTNFEHFVEISKYASFFSADFDQLLRSYNAPEKSKEEETPNMALVKFTRWCVLHDILRLPQYDHEFELEHTVFEMCRNILLAFALFVIVPMPPEKGLHGKIAKRLERILQSAAQLEIHSKHPDLFLCAIGWGFMCAHKAANSRKLGTLLRSFVKLLQLQTLVELKIDMWPSVAGVMKSFLWMRVYCDEPGRKFWACACGIADKDSRA